MNSGRVLAVAHLELRRQLRNPFLWALVLAIVGLTLSLNPVAMIPSVGGEGESGELFANSRYALAVLFCFSAFLIYSFFSAALAGLSIVRDDEAEVSELLHSTPLTPGEYIFGKLTGVLGTLAGVLVFHIVFAMLARELGAMMSPTTTRGPFHLIHYVAPALAFAVPAIWLSAALAFVVGERTRQSILVYAVPTVLFTSTLFVFLQGRSVGLAPALDALLKIFDPSGLRWLMQTVFRVDLGADFYNTAPLALDWVYWTRLALIITGPLLLVLTTVGHCRKVVRGQSRPFRLWPQRSAGGVAQAASTERTVAVEHSAEEAAPLATFGMTSAAPGFVRDTWNILRAELRELRGQPGIYAFVAFILLMLPETILEARGVYGAPLQLNAGMVATRTLSQLTLLGCFLLLFYTVESLHREKLTGFDGIFNAYPFRTGAMLLAKGLAGGVIVTSLLLAAALLCLIVLAFQPGGRLEVWPFAVVWGLSLVSFFLWQSFVMATFAAIRNRYLTYVIGLGVLVGTAIQYQRGKLTWVTNWPLWGTLRWSDMGLFDLNGRAVLLNRLLMLMVGLFLSVLARQLYVRAQRDPATALHGWRGRKLLGRVLRLAPFALATLAVGGYLTTQVAHGFQSQAAMAQAKQYWRQNVATWMDVQPPVITHVDLTVDLEPEERTAAIEGTFTMVNGTDRAMPVLPFTVNPAFGEVRWTLEGQLVQAEDRSDLHLLRPREALAPGQTLDVGFAYEGIYPLGMTKNGRGVEQFVLPSGVALHTLRDSFLPTPGFVDSRGIDAGNRYEPADYPEDHRDPPREVSGPGVPFTTTVQITAPSEYTVNCVGEKTAEIAHDGRTTVTWTSDYPVGLINIVAGRWQVRRQGDTAVFHHPGHTSNLEAIFGTLVAAREHYSRWFYPYPWKELKLSEFPNQVVNAQGFPTNIPFSEGIGFLERPGNDSEPFSLVTAHEAAHQWWGNILPAAEGPGTGHLVEGMAHFSALLLQEQINGSRGRIELAQQMEESYVIRRNVQTERPIAKMVDDQEPEDWTVVYEKGAWVMWMLQDHLGRDQLLAGLRAFIQQFHHNPIQPATEDLLETLRPFAADPEAYQAFVDQWFYDVVLPEFRVTEVEAEKVGDRWLVTALVENVGTGEVTVELAAMSALSAAANSTVSPATSESSGLLDDRLSVRLSPGKPERVRWSLAVKPERLVVDSDVLVLQRNRATALSLL